MLGVEVGLRKKGLPECGGLCALHGREGGSWRKQLPTAQVPAELNLGQLRRGR